MTDPHTPSESVPDSHGSHAPAPESAGSEPALDLSPRQVAEGRSQRRRLLPGILVALVVAGLGFVVLQTLSASALFFYNADEAIERRDELVEQRFRVQGTPFGEPFSTEVERDGRRETAVVFPISFDGMTVDVVHTGSPAEQFQPGVPVVLEGQWVAGLPNGVESVGQGANDGWHFASTDMIVKHDNEYRTANDDRIGDAERGGFAPDE